MNAYFFKMTKEEKENILDKHKHVYDGYVTEYVKPNQTPLYVQDFANDKEGVTVNNKGEVTTYKNMNINESDAFTGAVYLPEPTFEEEQEEYISVGAPLDMIGDGDDDLEHGTFEDEDNTYWDDMDEYDDEEVIDDIFSDEEFDEETKEEIKSKLKESIDMFNRFKKYN